MRDQRFVWGSRDINFLPGSKKPLCAPVTRRNGFDITIERPAGSRRTIRNTNGDVVYDRLLKHAYGYINNTTGRDGDEVDVIVGPDDAAEVAYVVSMLDLGPDVPARQDEDKVLIGFTSEADARAAFNAMYAPEWMENFRVADAAEFREEEHPRAENGQFGNGGSSSKSEKKTASSSLATAPTDRTQWPEHIKKLKLPPAWTDVRISNDPNAAMQAVGVDAKGRPQYVYSEKFRNSQAEAKFARIKELDGKFEKIRKQNAERLKSDDPKVRENAECSALVMAMGIRPGSNTDTKAKVKAYGATTLQGQHIVHEGGKTYLRFTGKKGVALNLPVTDPLLAASLSERAKAAGPNGRIFPNVSDKSLLDYTHTLDGGGFKTKDFRTLVASREAMQAVHPPPPKSEKEYKQRVLDVAKQVSAKLGNTPTVALQSYIPPEIFAPWRSGLITGGAGDSAPAEVSLPDVHFGNAESGSMNWREQDEDASDNDEELAKTPQDVIDILGFDPQH